MTQPPPCAPRDDTASPASSRAKRGISSGFGTLMNPWHTRLTRANNKNSMSKRSYYVYILTNLSGTLYVGVTNDLERRVLEHRSKLVEGFTKRFNVTALVYFEE